MCRLLETIRIEGGKPMYLSYHERRMNRSFKEIWGGGMRINLQEVIVVPEAYLRGTVSCNISYGPEIQAVTFKEYKKKTIRTLRLVRSHTIDYHLKYLDRGGLGELLDLADGCDEIIIVKDGLITDTSMSNLIFYDGHHWITPANPLLKGTCRERLIEQGFLFEREIQPSDLEVFTGCKLINAMRDPEEEALIPVSAISGYKTDEKP